MDQQNNNLILLCGGPDRCGKTNILMQLSKNLQIPLFKASNEHKNFLKKQDRFLNELRYSDFRMVDLIKQTKMSLLVDRSYMCEYVYSWLYARETDHKALRELDELYAEQGAKILICKRLSYVGLVDDLDPRLNGEALQRISDKYDEFLSWTKCDSFVLYVDDENLQREISDIYNWLFINQN